MIITVPQVHWGRPDIWLSLVSLGSEGSEDLSRPRCGIYCKVLTKQSHFYHLQYLFEQYIIKLLEYINTIHEYIIHQTYLTSL